MINLSIHPLYLKMLSLRCLNRKHQKTTPGKTISSGVRLGRNLLFSLFICLPITSLHAAEYVQNTDTSTDDQGTPIQKLLEHFDNLGLYLGFKVDQKPESPLPTSPLSLLNYSSENATSIHKAFELLSFYTFFAAIPVNAFEDTLASFTKDDYAGLNGWANYTFSNPSAYSSSSPSTVSAVKNIDQETYQNDPVNQSILNIIGTPDASFCSASSNSHCLSQVDILSNLLKDVSSSEGILPGTDAFFTYDNNQIPLSQLNPNTLLSPLLYSDSSSGGSEANKGLPKKTQEQQAADFIRYATGTNLFLPLISRDDYDALWTAAYTIDNGQLKKNTDGKGVAAQQTLAQYLTALRVYAAQSAVATGNLYDILSKRMPVQKDKSQKPTSQALSEFQMATWRMNNPQADEKNQWIDQINAASSATVEKEIAVLLSEINYQLYLSRQQQERLLLTDSLILIQTLAQNKPEVPSAEETKNQDSTGQ